MAAPDAFNIYCHRSREGHQGSVLADLQLIITTNFKKLTTRNNMFIVSVII